MSTPDLVEVQVPPQQVRAGDLLDSAADEATGPAEPIRPDGYVPVPVRSGGYALLPGDTLTTVRRPRPVVEPAPVDTAPDPLADLHTQVAEVRDLSLALADAQSSNTATTRQRVQAAADKVRPRGKA